MAQEIDTFIKNIGAVTPNDQSDDYNKFRTMFKRNNYFILHSKYLMVKISRTEKLFWGIGKRFVDLLNNSNWLLVLLVSSEEGWVFSKEEVNSNISNNKWRLREKDKNYKIYLPLPDKNSFHGHQDFFRKISLHKK